MNERNNNSAKKTIGTNLECVKYEDKQICEQESEMDPASWHGNTEYCSFLEPRRPPYMDYTLEDQSSLFEPLQPKNRRCGAGMAASTNLYHMPDEVWNRDTAINLKNCTPIYGNQEKLAFQREYVESALNHSHQNELDQCNNNFSTNNNSHIVDLPTIVGADSTYGAGIIINSNLSSAELCSDNWILNQEYMYNAGIGSNTGLSTNRSITQVPGETTVHNGKESDSGSALIFPRKVETDYLNFANYYDSDVSEYTRDSSETSKLKLQSTPYSPPKTDEIVYDPEKDNPLLVQQKAYDFEIGRLAQLQYQARSRVSKKPKSKTKYENYCDLGVPHADADINTRENSHSESVKALELSPSDLNQLNTKSNPCYKIHKGSYTDVKTFVDPFNVLWIQFDYPHKNVWTKYTINCDMNGYGTFEYSDEYKKANCIYPNVIKGLENGRNHRSKYEMDCNMMAWRLVQLNPHIARRRGLVQQAVNHFRNYSDDANTHSRRRAQILAREKERKQQKACEKPRRRPKLRKRKT